MRRRMKDGLLQMMLTKEDYLEEKRPLKGS